MKVGGEPSARMEAERRGAWRCTRHRSATKEAVAQHELAKYHVFLGTSQSLGVAKRKTGQWADKSPEERLSAGLPCIACPLPFP